MHAPHKHNRRITAVLVAAGAIALLTGTIVVGATAAGATAPGSTRSPVEAPEKLSPLPEEQGNGDSFPKVREAH